MTRQPDPAASRAVLIGVADYAEPERWEALPAVRANVADLRDLLCAPQVWGLPAEHCTTMVDPRDRLAVLEAISEAAEAARDTVLVYYSGHGATTEDDLLLTLSSTSSRNLGYSAVEFAAVRRVIQARRAMHAVIVLDCCFSGKAHAMADPQSLIDTQISATSAYTLTSSARNSISLAPPGERHTAFTGELLRVLRDGSPYAGELLTLADMTRAVSVALADKRMPAPRYSQSGPADVLALVRNRAWSPAPVVIEPPLPAVVALSPRPGPVAGIDLGGTNCSISLVIDDKPVTVPNSYGSVTTPSYVAFDGTRREVGLPALQRLGSESFASVVRLRMSSIGSPSVHLVDGNRYAMHDIARLIIARLKRDAEEYAGTSITAAAVAVPSDFTVEQNDMLFIAATGAGFSEVTFENSSVAAATAAGLLGDGRPVTVFDLGGTSLDVAVLDGEGEPLAFRVDRTIGAQAWADCLADMMIGEFKAEYGEDLSRDAVARRRLAEACEKAVEELSTLERIPIRLPHISANASGPIDLNRVVTRADLLRETLDLILSGKVIFDEAVMEAPAGLDPKANGRLLLTGGGSHIRNIPDMLGADWADIVAGNDPPGLVSRGAALLCARWVGLDVSWSG